MGRDRGAGVARKRLLDDQLLRPVFERQQMLSILGARLDRAMHTVLIGLLASRAKTDPRAMAVLRNLMRMPMR